MNTGQQVNWVTNIHKEGIKWKEESEKTKQNKNKTERLLTRQPSDHFKSRNQTKSCEIEKIRNSATKREINFTKNIVYHEVLNE